MGIGVGGHLHHVSGHIKDEMSGYHHSQESHHEHHSSSPPLHMSKGYKYFELKIFMAFMIHIIKAISSSKLVIVCNIFLLTTLKNVYLYY